MNAHPTTASVGSGNSTLRLRIWSSSPIVANMHGNANTLKRKFGSSSSNLIASSFRWTRLPILFTCFTFDTPADVRSVNQRKRKIQSEAAEPETLSPPTVFSNMSP